MTAIPITDKPGIEAYPLSWPDGWPRTAPYSRETDRRFGGRYGLRLAKARDQLFAELRLLDARNIVVSTNVPLRPDGLPYADERRIEDPGCACYFMLKKRPLVIARDNYISVAGNMRSLALVIDAMRQLERHGGSYMMERAFTGFIAIAPPNWKKPWREVFGIKPEWSGDITALYREKARNRHPDAGGNDSLMAELNVAYAEAKRELGA